MREITWNNESALNQHLVITSDDFDQTNGNAAHKYSIHVGGSESGAVTVAMQFQNGPLQEAGINGISEEALLAVVIDRLQCFQTSQYACRENALALTKLEEAVHWLGHRTQSRRRREVEGTSKV